MSRGRVRKVLRHAELCELLPETGQAWRDGKITSTAVELIAGARVAGCDEELVAVEAEFLDLARRGDHKTLQMLTQHFKACARADGSKPAPPDEFTVAFVGDRCVGRFDVDQVRRADHPRRAREVHPATRPRTTRRPSRNARPKASCGCVRSRSHAGPTRRRCPTRRVATSPTHGRRATRPTR